MPIILKDRVKVTTTTTGTGSYALGAAVVGYQSFATAGYGSGNTLYYAVSDDTNWEVGLGTYSTTGPTLARTTILESSNAGAAVNWGAGVKEVFVTYPAEQSVYVEGSAIVPATAAAVGIANGGTGQTTQTAGFDALSPATTKGDLIVDNGTNNVRLPVGTNNHVLTADSAQAAGIKWAAPFSSAVDVQEFSTVGTSTWTKPAGAKLVYIMLIGAGGGGGSGRRRVGAATAEIAYGGGGGGAGGRVEYWVQASDFGATVTVTIGDGGAGGLSPATNGTNGNPGSDGGATSFGSYPTAPGNGGHGGSTAADASTTAGAQGAGTYTMQRTNQTITIFPYPGAGRASANAASPAGYTGGYGPGGGGAGATFASASSTARDGGAGGVGGGLYALATQSGGGGAGGVTTGPAAGQGGGTPTNKFFGGDGGGGGATVTGGVGNQGGAGGFPGGGGGGGSASYGVASGAGGQGGRGFVRVVTFL